MFTDNENNQIKTAFREGFFVTLIICAVTIGVIALIIY